MVSDFNTSITKAGRQSMNLSLFITTVLLSSIFISLFSNQIHNYGTKMYTGGFNLLYSADVSNCEFNEGHILFCF